MKLFKSAIALLALAGGMTVTAMAGPAFASADTNNAGANCHGAYLSYLATSGMAPGQLHHEFGASVKNVQDTADAVCLL
jgi:hypothetical protein